MVVCNEYDLVVQLLLSLDKFNSFLEPCVKLCELSFVGVCFGVWVFDLEYAVNNLLSSEFGLEFPGWRLPSFNELGVRR